LICCATHTRSSGFFSKSWKRNRYAIEPAQFISTATRGFRIVENFPTVLAKLQQIGEAREKSVIQSQLINHSVALVWRF